MRPLQTYYRRRDHAHAARGALPDGISLVKCMKYTRSKPGKLKGRRQPPRNQGLEILLYEIYRHSRFPRLNLAKLHLSIAAAFRTPSTSPRRRNRPLHARRRYSQYRGFSLRTRLRRLFFAQEVYIAQIHRVNFKEGSSAILPSREARSSNFPPPTTTTGASPGRKSGPRI